MAGLSHAGTTQITCAATSSNVAPMDRDMGYHGAILGRAPAVNQADKIPSAGARAPQRGLERPRRLAY